MFGPSNKAYMSENVGFVELMLRTMASEKYQPQKAKVAVVRKASG